MSQDNLYNKKNILFENKFFTAYYYQNKFHFIQKNNIELIKNIRYDKFNIELILFKFEDKYYCFNYVSDVFKTIYKEVFKYELKNHIRLEEYDTLRGVRYVSQNKILMFDDKFLCEDNEFEDYEKAYEYFDYLKIKLEGYFDYNNLLRTNRAISNLFNYRENNIDFNQLKIKFKDNTGIFESIKINYECIVYYNEIPIISFHYNNKNSSTNRTQNDEKLQECNSENIFDINYHYVGDWIKDFPDIVNDSIIKFNIEYTTFKTNRYDETIKTKLDSYGK